MVTYNITFLQDNHQIFVDANRHGMIIDVSEIDLGYRLLKFLLLVYPSWRILIYQKYNLNT